MSNNAGLMVLVNHQNGVTIIPQPTPLTRLHYFDGKFLKAADLDKEQAYLRRLVELSNQAGGSGVAHGYDLSLAGGDALNLGPGLAIDPEGRVLLLPEAFQVGVQDLLDRSLQTKAAPPRRGGDGRFGDCVISAATPPDGPASGTELYLLSIHAAEALCGQEDVFGALCEDACARAVQRPYSVEGILLRATPLVLRNALPTSAAVALTRRHLRSRVASVVFEDERHTVESAISGAGLRTDVWCFGAQPQGGQGVPIGVLARAGATTVFLDAWTARRERIDPPAKRYWQWRMAMRPWDVFLAQILQFQCQLADLLRYGDGGDAGEDDPCRRSHALVLEASAAVGRLVGFFQANAATVAPTQLEGGLTALLDLHRRLVEGGALAVAGSSQFLIDGGIVTLPSAGYLPVTPSSVVSVNDQVQRLIGRGVDLRFCIIRLDFVPDALEEAQHMERISLLEGLEQTGARPQVDVLVPDGVALAATVPAGAAHAALLRLAGPLAERAGRATADGFQLDGAAHVLLAEAGGFELFVAAAREADRPAAWIAITTSNNPFAGFAAGQTLVEARLALDGGTDLVLHGSLAFQAPIRVGDQTTVGGRFSGTVTDGGTSTPIALNVNAVLIRHETAPRLLLSLADAAGGTTIEAAASWSGTPRKIAVAVAILRNDRQMLRTRLLEALLTRDDAVLQPESPLHPQALAALEMVGAGLKDPQFAARSAGQLFPAAVPAADLRIRAVLDWVLFRRRRVEQCHSAPAAPAIAGRRYQLWHGLVANQRSLRLVRDALQGRGRLDPDLVAFQRVDIVEFAAGVPTLTSPSEALHADWRAVNPGQQIRHAAVANAAVGLADGPDLTVARARAVEVALADVAPTASATVDLLETIPAELASPGLDGIVLLLTLRETTCATVVLLRSEAIARRVRALIGQGDVRAAILAGETLGEVKFVAGGTQVADASLDDIKARFDRPHEALVAVQAADPDLPPDLAERQGAVVHEALGGGPELTLLTSPQALPGCPMVVFVVPVADAPPRRVARVILASRDAAGTHTPNARLAPFDVGFAPDGSLEGSLPDGAAGVLRNLGGVVQVELAPVEAAPDRDAATARLKAFIEALRAAGAYQERSPPDVIALLPAEQPLGQGRDDVVFMRLG
jgi:hypothetical protein